MGIAAKVVYGIAETVKSLFDIGTPVLTVKRIPERYPVGVRSQGSAAVRQDEASRTVEVFKRSHKLALEHGTENPDGDQEIRTGADELHFGSKSCTGYDAVNIEVFDPLQNRTYKMGGEDAQALFEAQGSVYISYIKE